MQTNNEGLRWRVELETFPEHNVREQERQSRRKDGDMEERFKVLTSIDRSFLRVEKKQYKY